MSLVHVVSKLKSRREKTSLVLILAAILGLLAVFALVSERMLLERVENGRENEVEMPLSPENLRRLYPKPESMAAIFDHAYLLTTKQCAFRADLDQNRTSKYGIVFERIYGISYGNFTLDNPPIPIMRVPVNATVTAGIVSATEAHMRILKDAWAKGYNTTLILEDDVYPSEEISSHFPDVFQMIEGAARVHKKPWSVIVFEDHLFNT